MSLVTVFTPTYNRAKLLPRLYQSLCKQTCFDFEWLIVDDGSTDNTEEIINKKLEIRKSKFKVRYFKKENGGKHTAINLGIEKANTELFFIVDSDDVLTSDAIFYIKRDWELVKEKHLCGISYLRGYSKDKPIGDIFPRNHYIDSFNNVRVKHNISGDKAEVWATEYLKRMRFPVFKGEKFLVESWMWVQISDMADMLFVNKIIYLTEYLEGGLSKSGRKLRINCPRGGMAFSLLMMGENFPLKDRIKNGILYTSYSFFAHQKVPKTISCKYPILTIFCLPFGFCLYRYWNTKYNSQ